MLFHFALLYHSFVLPALLVRQFVIKFLDFLPLFYYSLLLSTPTLISSLKMDLIQLGVLFVQLFCCWPKLAFL